jgi:putative spermidine/putrescine transport system substrate-binding protein
MMQDAPHIHLTGVHERACAGVSPKGELHMTTIDRRRLLQSGAGLAAAAAGFTAGTAQAADTVHLLSWGWGYDKSIKDDVAARLKDALVELEIGTNTANYAKLLAQRSNPIISGGTFNGTYSYRGRDDKLWAKLDKSAIPNAANVPDHAYLETGGVVFGVQPYGIIYNPRFVEKPNSYLDLFDPKYKGKVGLADYIFDGFGLTAKAVGKSVDDVPAGIAEWAKHKANIGPWNQSPAHTNDLVESGELWLAFGFGGIATGAIANGKKIAYTTPSEGATQVADVVHVINGFNEKTTALTRRTLGLFLDDVAQLSFTRNVFTSPISTSAKIPAALASNPALLSPQQVAALHRPNLELSARKFGEYRNLANQQLKS